MSVLTQVFRDPPLAYYFGQKAVRNPTARKGLASLARVGVPAAPQKPTDPAMASLADSAIADLERNGLAMLPSLNLDAATVAAVRAQLRGHPLSDYYASTERFLVDDVPTSRTKMVHDLHAVLSCDTLVQLANHPLVLSVVGAALGAKPTLAAMLAWWTFGEHQRDQPTHFDDVYHRDVDDLAFIKLFAYLTDVTEHTGAHSYVRGSHRSSLLVARRSIADLEVETCFPGQATTLTAPAGTVFLENTWGIHRPLLATQGRRLLFSAVYTLRAKLPGIETHAPFPMPPGLDPYVNRRLYARSC
jgi:ectoine hydroxylase-related dioxygenase (phytanoyl-CoA dioxygenase family)